MIAMKSVCLPILLLAASVPSINATFTWDKDTVDNCEERAQAGRCFQDSTTFYQCPQTCSKDLKSPDAAYLKQGETNDGEAFWELEATTTNGKKLSFERYEGYVVLVVVVPLIPGMAQYYYDMLEHLHKVYPFTVEIVVFPVRREDYPNAQLVIPEKTKITVLPELVREGDKIESNPVLEYLEDVISSRQKFVFTDRVTSYIVAFNAKFIEKEDSPTLDYLEKLVQHYATEMDYDGWGRGEF